MNYDAIIQDLQNRVAYLERYGALDYIPLTDYSATSTIVGWASYTTKVLYYRIIGGLLFVFYVLDGTSDNTATTFTIPYNAPTFQIFNTNISRDNGGALAAGRCSTASGSNVITLGPTANSVIWTASGTKTCRGEIVIPLS